MGNAVMYLAGDVLRVTSGPDEGKEMAVVSVRMFATDSGYYLKGGQGLYGPSEVELAHRREGGNPCGTECSTRSHDLIDTCDHCRGVCFCEYRLSPGSSTDAA